MVWYIRFLKSPKLDQKGHVRALITVTTDLGDDFYPADLTLHAIIVTTEYEEDWMPGWQTVKWKSGMRTLWIDIVNLDAGPSVDLRLVVSSEQSRQGNTLLLENIFEILSVWSDTFDWEKSQASNVVERRYRTDSGHERAVLEETGESIARHIWDAGIALTAFLSTLVLQPRPTSDLAKLLQRTTPRGLRILELGSGCGLVGLQVADLCSTSDVLLTDLPEAMDVLNHNVEHARFVSNRGKIATAVLNWDEPLPERVAKQRLDLVIVSDCTYNPDSIPGLVKTLSSIAINSPNASVVVSMKVRHDSEAIFFELMVGAEFAEAEHTAIPLPDRYRSETGQELEVVEVYMYRSRKSA
ncbi:hypothetical protein HO173_007301 [Letharia columbiana]|uniref:Methyltransferase-domain-containing protein n=1 Tax=Letharia columbiana TaxID=112416 RepID=A0A8H6FTZ6_9LECA|nr:uncharacterized protein HO173_007301 [Letharia columbiana]KAF6234675.1 hypothetical protein HO173_007301 [Letharia columbiana]